MKIAITGGAGFLGLRLARELLAIGSLSVNGQPSRSITQVALLDRVAPPDDLCADARVQAHVGDLPTLLHAGSGALQDAEVVFHLAAAVSAECEADFDLGMRSNFSATHALLEACRALRSQPLFVFASSLAVFGQTPRLPLPEVVTDTTLPTPQSSYGIQKFIGEQLVADYARKGFVRGRNVRLMTVSVRPGRPNGAASGFLSGMIREPLAGVQALVPVARSTAVALSSPGRTIEGLVRAAQASDSDWGALTAINLPALTTTVDDMANALELIAGHAGISLLQWQIDPQIEKIVATWPARVASPRATGLGLTADTDFASIVRAYVRENAQSVKLTVKA